MKQNAHRSMTKIAMTRDTLSLFLMAGCKNQIVKWYQQETDNDADYSKDVTNCLYKIHLTDIIPLTVTTCGLQQVHIFRGP